MMENSKASDYMAYKWVSFFSHKPRRLHITVCLTSYLLSLFVQDATVCALMIPLSRGIVQVLENISIGHLYDETIEVKEDQPATPTKLTIGFLLGVAFSTHIGGIATLSGSDTGYKLKELHDEIMPGAKGGPITYGTYLAIAGPLSFILFLITLVHLQVICLGLFRRNSPTNLLYDNEASKNAVKVALDELPPMDLHQAMAITFWIFCYVLTFFLKPIFMPGIAESISGVVVKHSAIGMLICLFLFYLPNAADFLPYFICRRPKSYRTIPSLLRWGVTQAAMPWNYFFIHGSSMGMATGMRRTQWQACVNVFSNLNAQLQVILWVLAVGGMSVIGKSHLVAEFFIPWSMFLNSSALPHPGQLMYAIAFACRMTFFLPISSVSNCFACSWVNIKAKHVMMASALPVLAGLVLSIIFTIAFVPLLHRGFGDIMASAT
uniref:Citrate transporter-like domain-containing protein n=1 Tax=Glossina pallidipes TaxID=7398 RepID=A0A1B0A3L0_GLOPL